LQSGSPMGGGGGGSAQSQVSDQYLSTLKRQSYF
jgi:hypothetical protein